MRHDPAIGRLRANNGVARSLSRIDLGHWPDVATRVRPRIVPLDQCTTTARPLTDTVAVELCVAVGPGVVSVVPTWLDQWSCTSDDAWRRAATNLGADPAIRVDTIDDVGLDVVIIEGPLYTGGLLCDPPGLLIPRLPAGIPTTGWLAVPTSDIVLFTSTASTASSAVAGASWLARLSDCIAADRAHRLPPSLFSFDSGRIAQVALP